MQSSCDGLSFNTLNRLHSVVGFRIGYISSLRQEVPQHSSRIFYKSSPESSTAVIADIRAPVASGYTTEVSSVAEEKGKARGSEE